MLPEYGCMDDNNVPSSCKNVWMRHFGFVKQQTGRPIVIGQTGGHNSLRDGKWHEELMNWARENEFGIIYFALV